MVRKIFFILLLAAAALQAFQKIKEVKQNTTSGRAVINFNKDWSFAKFPQRPGFQDMPDNISTSVWSVIPVPVDEKTETAGKVSDIYDGSYNTRWYAKLKPQISRSLFPKQIIIDLSREEDLAGFRLLCRQDGSKEGLIKDYALYLSSSLDNWGAPASKGTFENSPDVKEIKFEKVYKGRYLKLEILSGYSNTYVTIAELGLMKPLDLKAKSNWQDQFFIMHLSGSDITEMSLAELEKVKNSELEEINKLGWTKVTLPHTANVEPLTVLKAWQGICYYEKSFSLPSGYKGKKIYITFDGMMQVSDVWLNGKHVAQKKGGYLPLTIDMTDGVIFDKENKILVRLDNQDNPLVPPGKPLSSLDFCYYGGIYRNVYLTVTDNLHITNSVYADKVRSGGVYVTYPQVSDESASVDVRTHIQNDGKTKKQFELRQELYFKGKKITSGSLICSLAPAGDIQLPLVMNIKRPSLWSPDVPNLYTLKTTIIADGKKTDEISTRIGIRKINYTREKGFEINGRQLVLAGTNRHQEYPYLGNAISDNAQYRDMKKIKEAGFNIVRLSHYPQAQSVLDACDELGLLVFDCAPGWQFFNNDQRFIERAYQDEREMIRRDRNHPCIVIWETSLNETYPPLWFRQREHDIAKEEIIGDCFTGGDTEVPGVPWEVPFAWFKEEDNDFDRMQDIKPEAPGIAREYGDYEFGGENSTTRVFRKEGEKKLLQAAWNFQWEHNKMMKKWPAIIGDATWVMFDYNRGCSPQIEASGISDIFRIPRFSYYFFKSQIDPEISRPFVYIANYWNDGSSADKIVVYSNCKTVELYLNGKLIASKQPDNGPDTPYGNLYNGGTPFDGGNCRNLIHAPFTFTGVKFEKGELKAVGKIDCMETDYIIRTPEKADAIKLEADISGKPLKADGADAIFVYANIIDKNGTLLNSYNGLVSFEIKGDAKIIGPVKINAEAGIAAILVQAGLKNGSIILSTKTDEGISGTIKINME